MRRIDNAKVWDGVITMPDRSLGIIGKIEKPDHEKIDWFVSYWKEKHNITLDPNKIIYSISVLYEGNKMMYDFPNQTILKLIKPKRVPKYYKKYIKKMYDDKPFILHLFKLKRYYKEKREQVEYIKEAYGVETDFRNDFNKR